MPRSRIYHASIDYEMFGDEPHESVVYRGVLLKASGGHSSRDRRADRSLLIFLDESVQTGYLGHNATQEMIHGICSRS